MIRASPDKVFAHVGRIDHLPRFAAPLWMTAEPVEKRRAGQVVALTGYLIGLPVESVQRVTLRPPHSIEFKQLRGTLRAFSGECTLKAVEDGTEVVYRLEVDPAISMISEDAARQFFVQFVERFLARITLAAERKAPQRRVARPTPGAPAPNAPDEEGEGDSVPDEVPAAALEDGAPGRAVAGGVEMRDSEEGAVAERPQVPPGPTPPGQPAGPQGTPS
ncbi:MAG TPA: SRPBCC family protein, partial [bacterium]|nr:SRPBCC family protein [bacterium]